MLTTELITKHVSTLPTDIEQLELPQLRRVTSKLMQAALKSNPDPDYAVREEMATQILEALQSHFGGRGVNQKFKVSIFQDSTLFIDMGDPFATTVMARVQNHRTIFQLGSWGLLNNYGECYWA